MLPVLTTKLHVPRLKSGMVARLHLVKRLDEGLWHTHGQAFLRRLTLVAAPAGYGKTALVSEWAGQLDVPVAWVTFDESDNDPRCFLEYLLAALRTIQPDIGQTVLAVLRSPQPTPTALSLAGAMAPPEPDGGFSYKNGRVDWLRGRLAAHGVAEGDERTDWFYLRSSPWLSQRRYEIVSALAPAVGLCY